MIQGIRATAVLFAHVRQAPAARSEPVSGAVGSQLSALARRRQLHVQQRELVGDPAGYVARPPYPFRPRPPS